MTNTKEQRAARRAAHKAELAGLLRETNQTLRAQIAELVTEAAPGTGPGTVLAIVAALAAWVDDRAIGWQSMEAVGAHIEMETIVYPSGTVSLDAAGDLMRVDFNVRAFAE